jgi:hypothetical protein
MQLTKSNAVTTSKSSAVLIPDAKSLVPIHPILYTCPGPIRLWKRQSLPLSVPEPMASPGNHRHHGPTG